MANKDRVATKIAEYAKAEAKSDGCIVILLDGEDMSWGAAALDNKTAVNVMMQMAIRIVDEDMEDEEMPPPVGEA